jgi:hypothetical protein
LEQYSWQNEMSSLLGPDFICIGMPKAGTGWLYDQLSHHPDFWMPPIKELHYLNHAAPRLSNSTKILVDWKRGKKRARRRGQGWGGQERSFVRDTASLAGQPRDVASYATLFRHKGSLLSGDISPGYCALDDGAIREIAANLAATRIILLVREPIARAWSHLCMVHRDGRFDVTLLHDIDGFREFANTRFAAERSFPTRIVERWSQSAPRMQFRSILFDDLEHRPDESRREILTYLGANPERSTIAADHNRKAGAKKLEMPDPIRKILVEYFGDEIHRCADRFGGAARGWPQKYRI